jgi:hypothetical protein
MLVTRIWQHQPGKYFCISTKSGTGAWKDHFFTRSEFKNIAKFLSEHSDRDIYFCPSGLKSPSRKKEEAVLPNLLWADLDEADPRQIKPKPTIAFESSPDRYVGLWLIDKPMSADLNRRLTYAVGADKSGWDLTQVLRFPGTVNYKYAATPKVRILWSDGESYRLADIEKMLPSSKDAGSSDDNVASEIYKRIEKKLADWARRAILTTNATGDRSEMLWKLECHMIEKGCTREETFTVLWNTAWNKFRDRAGGEDQMRHELDKIINKKVSPPPDSNGHRIIVRSMDEVEEEKIDWLYYPYLARGELTLLEGDPGLGKSYMLQMISAHICDGRPLPCVKKMPPCQGKVLYFDLENSAGTVTKQRLISNGIAHLENYIQCEEPFSIDDEEAMNEVYGHMERHRPVLVAFDTVNTYLGGADMYKGHEAQKMLVRFRNLAKRFNCAVVAVRHLTKSTKERALYRGQGSIAFAGIARIIMAVGQDPEDPDTRVMAVSKINFAKVPRSLRFNIDVLPDTLKEQDRSRFVWGDFGDHTADDILAAPEKTNSNKEDAKEFLVDQLNGHEVDFDKLRNMATSRGIPERTLQRVATSIGVVKKVIGFGKARHSLWSMPPSD